ncbi:DUF7079 family protein [Sphingomonas cannabina]
MRYEAALPHLDEIERSRRLPVWSSLSDLFLDTDVSLLRDTNARVLADSPYTINQIERIFLDEVTPACSFNLSAVAGEWSGFDEQWLAERIIAVRVRPGSGKPYVPVEAEWRALRDEVLRLRGSASLVSSGS